MANRPVFIPCVTGQRLFDERRFEFVWNPGFAASQKKKNVAALHAAAAAGGLSPLLEISTKSEELLGRRLSAFSLKIRHPLHGEIPLECAYQGSKVFEHGGPFTDLYVADPRAAKQDARLRESGRLIEFRFEDARFPLSPATVFYDWLYITALYPHREYLRRLYDYAGFTDIEFNPARSLSCQGRSCAMLVSMMRRETLDNAVRSSGDFIAMMQIADGDIAPRSAPTVERDALLFGRNT